MGQEKINETNVHDIPMQEENVDDMAIEVNQSNFSQINHGLFI